MNEWNGPVCELVSKLRLVGGNGEMMIVVDNNLILLLLTVEFIHGNCNKFCGL